MILNQLSKFLNQLLTQGPMVPRFEKLVAKKIGSKYAVALNSATSALHVGCMSLEIKKVI